MTNDLTLPRDRDLEVAVLGSLLFSESPERVKEVRSIAPPDCFFAGSREIYDALCDLADRGDSINPVMLADRLKERGSRIEPAHLAEMLINKPIASDLTSEIAKLRELATKRAILRHAEHWFNEAQARDVDVSSLVERIKAAAGAFDTAGEKADPLPIREVCIRDVEMLPIDWLWRGRIARGALTLFEGIEGEGKSTALCAIAAAVTCGRGLESMELDAPGNVLWFSAEDDLARVLKPRLLAAGACEDRVFAVGEPFSFDEKGVELVRRMILRRGPTMIVIDPVFAYTKGDPSRGHEARATTNKLKELAEEFNCALIMVRHVGKSKGLGEARAAGLYSIEWRAAARSVLLIGSDPDCPQTKAITQTKNNYGPLAESIGYVIELDPDSPSGARFSWLGRSELTAERILSTIKNDEEKAEKKDAEEFLQEILKSGSQSANDLLAEARRSGISERTLRRAKAALGIEAKRDGFGKKGAWTWSLIGCQEGNNGSLCSTNGHHKTYEDETSIDCQVAAYDGEDSLHSLPSGSLWTTEDDNPSDGNEIFIGCQNSELAAYEDDQYLDAIDQ